MVPNLCRLVKDGRFATITCGGFDDFIKLVSLLIPEYISTTLTHITPKF
jgi:hypothetical protein